MHTPNSDTPRKSQSRWEAFSELFVRHPWLKPASMVLASVGLVQFFAILPLQRHIVELNGELKQMHFALNRLVNVGDQAWQTNDLLDALQAQADQFDEAVSSLHRLQELQDEVVSLSQLADQARMQLGPSRDAIVELTQLENELAAHADRIAAAEAAVAEFESLHIAIASQADRIADVRNVVDQQIALSQTVLENGESIAAAQEQVRSYQNLASQVVSARDNSDQAEAAIGELIALQNTLLDGERLQVSQAEQNLQDLIALQDALASGTDGIADAVISLELLADFQDEFNFQVGKLDGMQQSLTQLILLESTVARTVRMIEPLAELTDLRRLNDDEVREAARIILDRRNQRISSLPVDAPPVRAVEETGIERLVPIPPEE